MITPMTFSWIVFIIILLLLLVVLLEISRSNSRRDNDEMFGSADFDRKTKECHLTDKEIRTLNKLVRISTFSNKDAVFNSPILFEEAVNRFYDFREVDKIRAETLDAVTSLRHKLGYMESTSEYSYVSSRQFSVGESLSISLVDISLNKHASSEMVKIAFVNEMYWGVYYQDGKLGSSASLTGRDIRVRLTRSQDAIYSSWVRVVSADGDRLILTHSTYLEKYQLRRWIREKVRFPVVASFDDGSTFSGFLIDLSAGGILVAFPKVFPENKNVNIQFEIPGFGMEAVDVQILRVLHSGRPDESGFISHSASFVGEFGRTQERVLQYIFEARKHQKEAQESVENGSN